MKILMILLIISILFSNPAFAVKLKNDFRLVSLDRSVLMLENDIKKGKNEKALENDVKIILNLKSKLPIYHIPEVNYLLRKEIDPIPETDLTFLKEVFKVILATINGVESFLFLISFLTFVLFFQSVKLRNIHRLILTILSIILLVTFFLYSINFSLIALGITLILLYKLRKIRIFALTSLFVMILIVLQATGNYIINLSLSNSYLYEIKVKRDGYAPEFLIKNSFKEKKKYNLEEVTNGIALGNFDLIKKIKNLNLKSSKLKQIYFNDLGYVAFQKGDYKTALNYFSKALSLGKNKLILYNLYLSYSSLLEMNKAEKLKKALLNEKIDISVLPPVPFLIHVPADYENFSFPIYYFISLFIGLVLGITISLGSSLQSEGIDYNVISLIGMKSFVEEKYFSFLLLSFFVSLINFLWGIISCPN